MWTIGAGIMIGGLISMVFVPMVLGFVVIGIGAALALAANEYEQWQECEKNNSWRKEYPTYKY